MLQYVLISVVYSMWILKTFVLQRLLSHHTVRTKDMIHPDDPCLFTFWLFFIVYCVLYDISKALILYMFLVYFCQYADDTVVYRSVRCVVLGCILPQLIAFLYQSSHGTKLAELKYSGFPFYFTLFIYLCVCFSQHFFIFKKTLVRAYFCQISKIFNSNHLMWWLSSLYVW